MRTKEPNEVWKPIIGFEERYEVSNLGRVRSLISNGKILKTSSCRGYRVLILRKDGKSIGCKLHRLVAEAFIPNPDNLPCVNHIDEDKNNNRADNIEWCSVVYNNLYGSKIERTSKSHSKAIEQYSLDGTFIKKWENAKRAAKECGCTRSNIQMCCNGKMETAKGYRWRYCNN